MLLKPPNQVFLVRCMTYNYGHYHQDGFGRIQLPIHAIEGDKGSADNFFANFNWDKARMITLLQLLAGLAIYDVFAGLELQRVVPTRPRSNGMTF